MADQGIAVALPIVTGEAFDKNARMTKTLSGVTIVPEISYGALSKTPRSTKHLGIGMAQEPASRPMTWDGVKWVEAT